MKQLCWYLFCVLLISACGGGDDGPPPQPEAALLVFPDQNSECTTGQSLNETLSQVTFEWQASANTDRYTLTVVNLETNVPQTITTQATSANLSIEKGAPFSWSVSSINEQSSLLATSESWLFYNAGPQTNYAPFPAQIITPKPGSTINTTANNEVELRWSGTDVENDIATFEVYFSDQNPPTTLLTTTFAATMRATATIATGTTYYWRVVTIDAQGNRSDSGVFDFKVF